MWTLFRTHHTCTTKYDILLHELRHRSVCLYVGTHFYQIQLNNTRSFKVTDFGTNRIVLYKYNRERENFTSRRSTFTRLGLSAYVMHGPHLCYPCTAQPMPICPVISQLGPIWACWLGKSRRQVAGVYSCACRYTHFTWFNFGGVCYFVLSSEWLIMAVIRGGLIGHQWQLLRKSFSKTKIF